LNTGNSSSELSTIRSPKSNVAVVAIQESISAKLRAESNVSETKTTSLKQTEEIVIRNSTSDLTDWKKRATELEYTVELQAELLKRIATERDEIRKRMETMSSSNNRREPPESHASDPLKALLELSRTQLHILKQLESKNADDKIVKACGELEKKIRSLKKALKSTDLHTNKQ